jgi:hypothetical protein
MVGNGGEREHRDLLHGRGDRSERRERGLARVEVHHDHLRTVQRDQPDGVPGSDRGQQFDPTTGQLLRGAHGCGRLADEHGGDRRTGHHSAAHPPPVRRMIMARILPRSYATRLPFEDLHPFATR